MKSFRKYRILVCLVLISLIAGACQPVSPTGVPPTLSVQVTPKPAGPQVAAQDPLDGQRMALSQPIKITFDQAMNPGDTLGAFSFSAPDGQTLPGVATWLDPRTFQFTPEAGALKPATTYRAAFGTKAASASGVSPADPIELNFTTAEGLEVAQVFPTADAENIDQKTNVTVIFNHPVVPLSIAEEQSKLPQPVELSPAVAGQGQWVNSSVYVFAPDKAFVGGIRYTVRVGAGLKDTVGNTLDKSFVWQFTTRPAGIDNFAIVNGPANPPLDNIKNVLLDQKFAITFKQPMNPDSVTKALSITDSEKKTTVPLALTWDKTLSVLTIQPKGRYAIASYYDLQITEAAQAADGGALTGGFSAHFGTVPLPSVLNINPPNTQGFDNSFSIQFASPMKLDSLKGKVVISPPPSNPAAVNWYYSDYDFTYRMYGLDPGTEYVVRTLPGMTDIYGNAITTETTAKFTTSDIEPNAHLAMPWTPIVYRAHGPQEAYFEYTNVTAPTVSLYPLTLDEFTGLLHASDPTTFKPSLAMTRQWTPQTLPAKNKLGRLHITLQDQKGNALTPGYYLLGVTGSNLRYSSTGRFFQVSLAVVATDNITFKATATEGLAWVTDLETGKPQSGAMVTFYSWADNNFKQVGTTVTADANGLAYLKDVQSPNYAAVNGNGHLAFVGMDWGSGVWAGDLGIQQNYYAPVNLHFAYLYTDRPVYRPVQDVYFKGLVRQNDDLHYSLPKEAQVHVSITDPSGQEVYAKDLSISQLGSIDGDFKIGNDAPLGTYSILIKTADKSAATTTPPEKGSGDVFASLAFRVAEYHKPTFQVAASTDKPDVLAGEQVQFTLDASYYSGGNVGNGKVYWFTEGAPWSFAPDPKYTAYSFADWDRDMYYSQQQQNTQGGTIAEGHDVTDANGHLAVPEIVDLGGAKADRQVTFNANVTDVAGDTFSGSTSVVVHQSEIYAGIRATSYIGTAGKPTPFDLVVLDWASKPVAGQSVTVKFVERKWFSVQKQDAQGQLTWVTSVKDIPVTQQTVKTGSDGTAQVSFVPPHGGDYKAIAMVTDGKGNQQQSSTFVWVTGNEYIPWRQTNDRSFNLIADKDTYSPGDTAELLIAQPFQGSVYALVTYERGHIYKQDVILLNGNSTVYKLPITPDMAPAAYVSVVVVSGADNTKTPDFKIGMARLNVDTSQQKLDVKVTTDKTQAGPNDTVTYTVTTKDASGKPVSADVSLAVADKAALALAPMNSAKILDAFYPVQGLGVQTALGLTASADDFNAQYKASLPEGGGAGGGGGQESFGIITVRQNFKDTAFFQATLTTDQNGQAQVQVKLPENLTTWVADARAATADGHVGQAANEIVSSKPLLVDLQTPRFFVAGDAARIGAVVHNNQTDSMKVDVALTAQGVQLQSPETQTITVDAKGQGYVTWDVRVNDDAQRVDLTAQATSGTFSDASKPPLGTLDGQGLPVYTYDVPETVGTSGMLTDANSATENIQLPKDYPFTDAQLLVNVEPSLAASMQTGLTYLQNYPYMCMEQTVSTFLPNVVTTRALKQAGISNPTLQSNLDANVSQALQRIYAKQLPDGGWNWWDGDKSDPQTSAYVVLGLEEAKDAGYTVSQTVLDNGIQYVNTHLPNIYVNAATYEFNRYAFMLYVLARGEVLQAGQTNVVYNQRDSLSLYGKAYLAQALYMLDKEDPRIQSLMSDLAGKAIMSSSGTHWEEKDYNDYWNWNTDTRTTAIVLNAFIQIDPKNLVTANAVRWLMAHRQSGHWNSTQETAWSLIALTNWLTATKEFDSNYSYAVGLNGASLQQGQVTKSNLTDVVKLTVQNKDLLKDVVNTLVFTRNAGNGNLYYDSYLRVTLPVTSIQPLDQGASISRQYFTLTDPKKPITEIQRGQLVRVRLTVVLPASMHYIVIDDPLPAGLEAVDASIQTDTAVPTKYTVQDYNERGWGWWYFTHIENRDEKVVLSTDYLPAGTYVYTYLARASTVGTYQVIPPTAAEFYFPDVGGRGAGSEFIVKP